MKNIYIITALTKDYFKKSMDLFKSMEKHAQLNINGQEIIYPIVICVDFYPSKKTLSEFTRVKFVKIGIDKIKTVKEGWPLNRDKYICLESGEFLQVLELEDDGIIVHIDADITMQRPISLSEIEMLQTYQYRDIGMATSIYPNKTMYQESLSIMHQLSQYRINEAYPIVLKEKSCLCAGIVIATVETYKEISDLYVSNFLKMTDIFGHHAAGQFLLNYIAHSKFNFREFSNVIHNGEWFTGTDAREENGYLMTFEAKTLFNHHKYNDSNKGNKWKY